MITQWNAREVKAQISGDVAANMDSVCQFVRDQARGRAPTLTGLLASSIDYELSAGGETVSGRVGVKKGRAFYGWFHEVGTRKMAAHPFLRPAVWENVAEILRRLAGE